MFADLLLTIGEYSGHAILDEGDEYYTCECGKSWDDPDINDMPEDHATRIGAQTLGLLAGLPPASTDFFLRTMAGYEGTLPDWVASCRETVTRTQAHTG